MNRLRAITAPQILLVLLVVSAAVHAVHAVRLWDDSRLAIIDAVLVVVDLVIAGMLARTLRTPAAQPVPLLSAAVAGAIGVATFLLPSVLALAAGRPLGGLFDGWAFAALLVDAIVVRIAIFALKRTLPTG
ncbi:hypothetical protein Psed_4460 [Pseudonocardia dioxanivorans CB1190]|uniref:Uncharacterized protein n=1 Tax=Pseudonocardia dioxanivorans (strain ATCC 55486 / DSM 44775 / JCM 13855 / CB1190) TaxID=675635 RepID=F4CYP6_PSEUX|nr:hypothetical protein [Pseudonocardia dioxanivorans]AEA26616.1 hypothetical protein Psed_4460 [Pseudonocardia dioxanivorans CB1190]GJF05726.1 hypothetical protein PSD17_46760 [Pseudonocardia sp. D17]